MVAGDEQPDRDELGEGGHVRDDPHHPVAVGQVLQRLGHHLERGRIQCAEPLIEKDRVEPGSASRGQR